MCRSMVERIYGCNFMVWGKEGEKRTVDCLCMMLHWAHVRSSEVLSHWPVAAVLLGVHATA